MIAVKFQKKNFNKLGRTEMKFEEKLKEISVFSTFLFSHFFEVPLKKAAPRGEDNIPPPSLSLWDCSEHTDALGPALKTRSSHFLSLMN